MRMEAKNSYFKRIAQIGNFKNIPLSVARCHQKFICAHLSDDDYFENTLIVGHKGMYVATFSSAICIAGSSLVCLCCIVTSRPVSLYKY